MEHEYGKNVLWVKEAINIVNRKRNEEEERNQFEFCKWFVMAHVMNVESPIFLPNGTEMKWVMCVNEEMKKLCRWRSIIEIKESTALIEGKKGLLGLFAAMRFERGEIITVQKMDEESQSRVLISTELAKKSLYFGGGVANDASTLERKTNNAIANDEGVVRAMQRILPGQEIFIDYKKEKRHPVEYLDVIVEIEADKKGKVSSFGVDEEGKVFYLVKGSKGKVIKLSEDEVVLKSKRKTKRTRSKRKRNLKKK
jgi:hypothetical protein